MRALLGDELTFMKVPLTGPEPISHEELVVTIGEAIGRPLHYQEIPPDAYGQSMIRRGFPEPFVQALLARYARGMGPAEAVTGEVERILGRPARTYAAWVADHADAFRALREG
ncbi:hypothetical protein ACFMQL_33430 [Nonomuraea fastidiosa]|uniref:hypothetical protein n=1 Tax=Nonomuraea fastidiosa TaxID=46173 RepID=UPI00366C4539